MKLYFESGLNKNKGNLYLYHATDKKKFILNHEIWFIG